MLLCMCMLNKRTNILLSKSDYRLLSFLATKERVSIGKLIRKAIREIYQAEEEKEERRKVVKAILSLRKKQKGTIDYKALIEDGRKV